MVRFLNFFILVPVLLTFSEPLYASQLMRGAPYLKDCDLFLRNLKNTKKGDNIEEALLKEVKTPEEMIQILYDYKIFFSREFIEAFRTTVKNGFVLDTFATLKELERISKLTDDQFREVLWKIVDRLPDLRTHESNDDYGQINHLQAQRLVAALKEPPHRALFESVGIEILHDTVLDWAREISYAELDLIKKQKNPYSDRVFLKKFIISSTVLAILTGNIYGALTHYSNFLFPDASISSLSGAFVGIIGGSIAGTLGLKAKNLYKWFLLRRHSKFEANLNFQFVDQLGSHQAPISHLAFGDIPSENSFLSLSDASQLGLENLNPVQIAYLGHVELLELQAINEALKATMNRKTFEDRERYIKNSTLEDQISYVNNTARLLRSSGTTRVYQEGLTYTLVTYASIVNRLLLEQSQALEYVTSYLQALKENLTVLRNKADHETLESSADIQNQKFLLAKLSSDLENLRQLRIETKVIERKIARTKKLLDKLDGLLKGLPKLGQDWTAAAESILLNLDEISLDRGA